MRAAQFRYRAERLRELDARLARRLRLTAPPEVDDSTRSWEESDQQGYDGTAIAEGEDTDGRRRPPSKYRREIVAAIVAAKEETFDDKRINPVPSEASRPFEQTTPSVDGVTFREGTGSRHSGEGRRRYQDTSRENAREDAEKISPSQPLLGRPPLPPSHKHGPRISESWRHYSLRHEDKEGAGVGASGCGARKEDFPEGLNEVHTETASIGSGVALGLWGDEDDDAFLPWRGNASPAAWKGRGVRAGCTFPMLAESSDRDQAGRECMLDGGFPRRRTSVGRGCNVDAIKHGQVDWTKQANREDGDDVDIVNKIDLRADAAQAKQRRSPFQNRLRTVSAVAESGVPRVAAKSPRLWKTRESKMLDIDREVHGDSQSRHRHGADEVESDHDSGFDGPPPYSGIAEDARWCGPSELREEQRVLPDDEEAWKKEGGGIAPESDGSDDFQDEYDKQSGRKRVGPPTANRSYKPRLEKDDDDGYSYNSSWSRSTEGDKLQALDSTSGSHRSRESWGRPHEDRDRVDRNRWEAARRVKAESRTSREAMTPTSEPPRVGTLDTFGSSLRGHGSNVVHPHGGSNNLASSQRCSAMAGRSFFFSFLRGDFGVIGEQLDLFVASKPASDVYFVFISTDRCCLHRFWALISEFGKGFYV